MARHPVRLLAFLLLSGCPAGLECGTGTEELDGVCVAVEGDADADADADTDTDADADTDTDADTDPVDTDPVDTDLTPTGDTGHTDTDLVVDTDPTSTGDTGDTDPVCTFPDPLEPNDTVGTATPATSGTALTLCPNDRDVFTFEAAPGELVIAHATFDDSDGDVDILLRDASGILDQSQTTQDEERVVHLNTSPDPVTLFLEVYGYQGASNPAYDWTLARCDNDPAEPNDTLAEAVPLVGTDFISPVGDVDWFSLDVAADTLLELAIDQAETPDSYGHVEVELWDASGSQVGSISAPPGAFILSWLNAGPATTVFVRAEFVTSQAPVCQTYSLTPTFTTVTCPAPDAAEPNDEQAFALPTLGGDYTLDLGDPADWFIYTVPPGRLVEVAATPTSGDATLQVYLTSPLVNPSPTPLDVWVGVERQTGNCAAYTLTFTDVTPVCVDDPSEPDGTFGTAAALADGSYALEDGGEDWFGTEVADGERLAVSVDSLNEEVELEIALVDASGAVLDVPFAFDDTDVSWVNRTGAPVSVAAVISSFDQPIAFGCVPYTLTSARADCSAEDAFEPNGTRATAVDLTAASDLHLQSGDQDFWALGSVPAGATVTASIAFDATDADLELQLQVAANGTVLDSATSAAATETVEWTNNQAGPVAVVLRVHPYTNTCETPYSLTSAITP